MSNSNTFLSTQSMTDIFSNIRNTNGLCILGGGTFQGIDFENAATLNSIPELSLIEKRERYIDFGAAVKLSQILYTGRENIPPVLYDAVESIGTNALRNVATIGGNICASVKEGGIKGTLWAPLLALDALLEFKDCKNNSTFLPFSKFKAVPEDTFLAKIRLPMNDYEISIFRRVGPASHISQDSASYVFLADTEKNSIIDIKMVFAGPFSFRSAELENQIMYTKLPLSRAFIEDKVSAAENIFNANFSQVSIKPMLKAQFLNLLRYSFEQLM